MTVPCKNLEFTFGLMQLLSLKKTFLITILFSFLFSFFSFAQSNLSEGISLFNQGELSKAKTFFNNSINSEKQNPVANFYLGRVYFDEGDYEKAVDWIEKASKYDKQNSTYYMWLGHSYGRRAQNAGKLKQAFLARDSRNNYEKAIELDPTNVEARESAMEFYLQAPGFMGGGRDKAEAQAEAINNLDKEAGYMAWGRIFSFYNEDEKSFNIYTEAIKEIPTAMGPYYSLFSFYFNNEQYEEAVEITLKQLNYNDSTATIYYNLGNALQWSDQFDKAIDAYEKALEINPEFYSTWYQIGRLAAVSNTYVTEGEEYLIQLVSVDAQINSNTLAWAHYRLGSIYEKKSSLEAAKEQYQMTLNIDNNHDEAKKALARLN